MVAIDGQYRIGGALRTGDPAAAMEIRSPIDGSLVGRVHEFSPAEIDEMFEHVRAHQPGWAATPTDERSRILHATADALEAGADELAELLVMEIAKSRKDSRDEIVRSADFIRHTAEEAKRLVGEAQFSDAFARQGRDKLSVAYRVPLGVVLAIPPFNYPVNLAISKIAPALAAGNAVVLKPPTQGSVTGTVLGEMLIEAGVPAGVLQVVTGRGSRIGDLLVQHPAVDMVTFTGSSEVGRELARKVGMAPLLLELGGKDAAIVLPDADLDRAADDIVAGAFAYGGQRCTAVKRVLVLDSVADDLVVRLAERVAALTVGDPRDDCKVPPLINEAAAVGALELTEQARQLGAQVIAGGTREGNLVAPTLIDHVTSDMDVAWIEPFAPVLPVLRVKSAEEAIRLCNESEYGLQAAVFTADVNTAIQLGLHLDVGTVQINGRTARGPDHFPFIGTKSSGMGAQGVRYSLEAMTRLKSVVFNLHPIEPADMT